jgi:hypothetical protein
VSPPNCGVVASKVHFDRLKIHRNKRLLLLLVVKEGVLQSLH